MKTINQIYREIKSDFERAGLDTPDLDARFLIEGALDLTHESFLLKSEEVISEDQEKTLIGYAGRRLAYEPVSKILGQKYFWKSCFKVTLQTLDPRPDSETLIEAALECAPNSRLILDCGTGSGCLLLSLLQEWPQARGIGLDISPDAVSVAAVNARDLALEQRVAFYPVSWECYQPGQKFDLVISNPPYIAETEKPRLSPEVTLYDPAMALFGGEDGLGAYRSLAAAMPQMLAPGGTIIFEIGYDQANTVTEIMDNFGYQLISLKKDLGQRDRVLIFREKV